MPRKMSMKRKSMKRHRVKRSRSMKRNRSRSMRGGYTKDTSTCSQCSLPNR